MKIRAIKRRFSGVVKRRLLSPLLWRSAQDIAWNRSRPVGREFGSPDYERLMALNEAAFAALGSMERVRQWLDAPNADGNWVGKGAPGYGPNDNFKDNNDVYFHRGYNSMTGSAGCQTFPTNEFEKFINALNPKGLQTQFNYYLKTM